MDNWQPSQCKHGVWPTMEQEWISIGAGPFDDKIPGRKTIWYDCPTPDVCGREAYARRKETA